MKAIIQRRVERAQETKQANRKISSRDTRESENQRERTQGNNVRIERGNEGISR